MNPQAIGTILGLYGVTTGIGYLAGDITGAVIGGVLASVLVFIANTRSV